MHLLQYADFEWRACEIHHPSSTHQLIVLSAVHWELSESDESDGENDEDSESSVDETIHEEGEVTNRFHSDINTR